MKTFSVLLANQWLIFKNTCFRTKRRSLLALGVLLAALGAMTGITLGAAGVLRPAFAFFGGKVEIALPLMLSGLFSWLILAAFAGGAQAALPRFYRSPDLNLLISLPVSAKTLFVARFLFTMLSISSGQLFIMLPMLIATGIVVDAQIGFYLLALPIFFLVCAVPAALSIALLIVLVRWLSPKRIMQAGVLLGILSNGLFIFLVSTRGREELFTRILALLEAVPLWLLQLSPPGMAAELFTAAALGDLTGMIAPIGKLIAIGIIITAGSLLLVQRFYHRGFTRLQEIAPQKKRAAAKPVFSTTVNHTIPRLGRWGDIAIVQWQQGLRNHEAALIALGMLAALIGYIVTMALIELPVGPRWSGLLLFGHIGVIAFLSGLPVSILLIPLLTKIEVNPRILKERYWLCKVAALDGRTLFWSEWLANFLPVALLGAVAITALNIAIGSGIWASLGSLLLLCGLLAGWQAIDSGFTFLALNLFYEQKQALGTVIGLAASILFFVLVVGPVAIGQGGYAVFAPLRFIGDLPQWILHGTTIGFSLAVVVLTIYFSGKLGAKHWDEMEI